MRKSTASDEQRQADLQYVRQSTDGLARAYQEQSEENCRQVLHDRENSAKANRDLREDIGCYTRRYLQDEAETRSQMQKLSESANYWRAESEQEGRVATRFSEHSNEVAQRCIANEHALRQSVVPNMPQNQVELRGVISKIEQEAMLHVRTTEQRTEQQLEQSSKQARLLNEEIYARNVGIHMATQRGDKAEAEVARIELLLSQEKATLFRARHGQSETHEVAVQAQTKYVQSLKAMEGLKIEYGEAFQSYQEESVMYHEESGQCYE